MVDSVIEDFKNTFRRGNMISKIILVNAIIFIILNLIKVFAGGASQGGIFIILQNNLSIPASPSQLLRQPWSIFTHMFTHIGLWHVVWNMILLYWFGRIVGDLLGDRRVLPIYVMGGLFGALIYIVTDQFFPGGSGGSSYALGASAAVMAMIWTAATVSPDYLLHLLFIGAVKLKYVALGLLFIDIIGTAGNVNSGGHYAHIGGAIFGMLFVYLLHRGTDLTAPFADFRKKEKKQEIEKTPRRIFKVISNNSRSVSHRAPETPYKHQDKRDDILDKINKVGYEELTEEEKAFLYNASKKK